MNDDLARTGLPDGHIALRRRTFLSSIPQPGAGSDDPELLDARRRAVAAPSPRRARADGDELPPDAA